MTSKNNHTSSQTLTLDKIAHLAGTSKSTVSRVISNDPRISEKTRMRVLKVIEQQHYRPNLFARALAGGNTGLIGVISSNIGSGFYAEIIRGIDLVFNKLDKRLLVSFAHFEKDYIALWQDMVLGGQVEGLIVLAPTSDFFKLSLSTTDVPIVICVGRPPKGKTGWEDLDRINMNNNQAMDTLVSNLVENGHKEFLHAAGWTNNSDAVDRMKAFTKACRKYGVHHHSEYFGIIQADGRSSMEKYLSHNDHLPDAIICFNDSIALGILEAWHIHAGQDAKPPFAITGWDDSPAAGVVGLTSVTIPCIHIGEESAHLLDNRIKDKTMPVQNVLIDLTIANRASSVAASAPSRIKA